MEERVASTEDVTVNSLITDHVAFSSYRLYSDLFSEQYLEDEYEDENETASVEDEIDAILEEEFPVEEETDEENEETEYEATERLEMEIEERFETDINQISSVTVHTHRHAGSHKAVSLQRSISFNEILHFIQI